MERPKIINTKGGEEASIQEDIIKYLKLKDWFVKVTHGNMYQSGFPDLYATHQKYGARWIEVKKPKGYSFTPAQLRDFPLMCANGSPIWIMTAATDCEYAVLFRRCNWAHYYNLFCVGL